MIIYMDPLDVFNYRVCVLAREKEVIYELKFIDHEKGLNENILQWNPHAIKPVIDGKDLSIAGGHVITEYLEDRYPFPPLFPSTPTERANARYLIATLQREWMGLINVILKTDKKHLFNQSKKALLNILISRSDLFKELCDNNNNQLNIIDCTLLPILHVIREKIGINFTEDKAINIIKYINQKQEIPSFVKAMEDLKSDVLNKTLLRFE